MNYDTAFETNRDEFRYPVFSAVVATVLIMFIPFLPRVFAFIPFLIFVLRGAKYGIDVVLVDIVLVAPFNAIYKTPNGVGFMEYYLLLFEGLYFLQGLRSQRRELLGVVFSLCFLLIISDGQIGSFICIAAGMLFLYIFKYNIQSDTAKKSCIVFPFSLVVSSIYALIFAKNANVQSFLTNPEELIGNLGGYRFQGLFLDPNYYAVYLLVSSFLLLSSIFHTEGKKLGKVLILAATVYFGLTTYSRMYYLSLGVFFAVWILASLKAKEYKNVGLTLGLIAISLLYVLIVNKTIAYNIAVRFTTSDVTSGRSAIYLSYWEEISRSFASALVGHGLGAPLINQHGSHNLFLEISYFAGIPFLLYFLFFFSSACDTVSRRFSFNRGAVRYYSFGGLFVLLFMYISLQGFFSVTVYLQVALLLCGSILADKKIRRIL